MLVQEALSLVLSKLDCGKDLVRCAAVSKVWAAASTTLQPSLLQISYKGTADEEYDMACSQLRLLQCWQQQGRLQKLERVPLVEDRDVNTPANPSPLSHGVILLAGIWNFSTFSLHGPFSVKSAVDMLPPNLVSLSLWPNSGPGIFHMSALKRFTKLVCLKLGFGTANDEQWPNHQFEFNLDKAMPSLQLVIVHDMLRCTLAQNMTVEVCCPEVGLLSLKVQADAKGKNLIEGIVALPNLKIPCLKFYDKRGPP